MTKSVERLLSAVISAVITLVSVPLVVMMWLISPVVLAVFVLLNRLGLLRSWQSVDLLGRELSFHWSRSNPDETKESLSSAVSLLVTMLPRTPFAEPVTSMRFINPESGMVLRESCLSPFTQDFGPHAASLLIGECVEAGRLELNRRIFSEHLNIDARSTLSGHFCVELPFDLDPELLEELEDGFQL